MSTASNEVYAALGVARKLPGWTVNRLDTGAYRVTSPSGIGLVPADLTTTTCATVLAGLDDLGLRHDRLHRFVPQPRTQPVMPDPIIPNQETDTAVPTTNTTKTARAKAPTAQRKPSVIKFDFPVEPQVLPLSALMPAVYAGQGRLMVPTVAIDVEIATEFFALRADQHNRRLRRTNIDKFRRLITDSEFNTTHQGIAFNTDGEVADGQHRLKALIDVAEENPGISIVVDLTYNAPVEHAKAYDGGANRNNVDRLQVAGIDRADKVAPLVRLLYTYEEVRNQARSWKEVDPMSQNDLIDWADNYGPALIEAWEAVRKPLRGTFMPPNVAAVAYFLAQEQWPEAPIDEFIEAIGEPTMQGRGTPQRALAGWLRRNQTERKRTSAQLYLAMFLVAYNDWCQGTERQQMKWMPIQGMPTAYAPAPKPKKKK